MIEKVKHTIETVSLPHFVQKDSTDLCILNSHRSVWKCVKKTFSVFILIKMKRIRNGHADSTNFDMFLPSSGFSLSICFVSMFKMELSDVSDRNTMLHFCLSKGKNCTSSLHELWKVAGESQVLFPSLVSSTQVRNFSKCPAWTTSSSALKVNYNQNNFCMNGDQQCETNRETKMWRVVLEFPESL